MYCNIVRSNANKFFQVAKRNPSTKTILVGDETVEFISTDLTDCIKSIQATCNESESCLLFVAEKSGKVTKYEVAKKYAKVLSTKDSPEDFIDYLSKKGIAL